MSCDEQKIGFLGQDQDKLQFNAKKDGHEFQVDCICGKGLLTAFIFTM